MVDKYEQILHKVNIMEKQISKMEITLSELVLLMKHEVSPSCNKMNSHINFVENVYTKIKKPLHYICNKFNSSSKLLPSKSDVK